MRALGQRLGSAATAVYWHVGSKENLIALAGDQAWSEIPLPDLETLGWREAAKQMATGLYAMLTRHPWLLQAFGSFLILSAGRPATMTTASRSSKRPASSAPKPINRRP
jgi:AcrR family transcriptional regulator